ncbi:hypothetical protein BH09PLA1_BH09PLA1_03640 [soil metagenome]
MIDMSGHESGAGALARYRGVFIRVGGLIAFVIAIALGVRLLIGGGPEEKYRFSHPAGYSVIHPADWTAKAITQPDSDGFIDAIGLAPERAWVGQQPSMWVRRYAAPPDLAKLQSIGFAAGTFEGQPAWVSQQKPKRHLFRTAIFQRGDDWFNVGVALPGLEGAKVDDWWRFIESFQFAAPAGRNNPKTHPASTQSS